MIVRRVVFCGFVEQVFSGDRFGEISGSSPFPAGTGGLDAHRMMASDGT
jgi:hypothetical protein